MRAPARRRSAPDETHGLAGRPPEVWTLVALDLLGAVIALLAAVAPAQKHRFFAQGLGFGAAFFLLAAAIWLLSTRLNRTGLFLATAIGIGLVSGIVSSAKTAEGTAVITFAFIWTTIYAASFLRRRDVKAVLVLIAIGSMAALIVNGLPRWQTVWLVLNATTVTAGLVVSRSAAELRRAAETDVLTGVLNRRGFHKQAEIERAVSTRIGGVLLLAIIDLDGFKAVNDEAGHSEGDRMLIEATAAWSRHLRPGDLLGRFGGDEFVLLLPMISTDEVELLLGRLRAAHPIRWTAGAARWEPDESLEACMKRADTELYARKYAGGLREETGGALA